MDERPTIQVIEMPEFVSTARKLFNDTERSSLLAHFASRPDDGKVIPGTGGLRKLRWASKGKGKRGGARVIYFFHSNRGKVYLFTAYGKNQREDLSPKEKSLWKNAVKLLTELAKE